MGLRSIELFNLSARLTLSILSLNALFHAINVRNKTSGLDLVNVGS